jgi:crotonobetaine/carnitine-CoA ligase
MIWRGGAESTIHGLLQARIEANPDGPYLDVCGRAFTAREVDLSARRIAAALVELGIEKGDRVASLAPNSPEALLYWWGVIAAGAVAVPINSAYKGAYLQHQLVDSGARMLFVHDSLFDRAREVVGGVPDLERVVIMAGPVRPLPGVDVCRWEDLEGASPLAEAVPVSPSDLGTFIYTGGTTGPSKGCMLSQNYHEALARQIVTQWQADEHDVVWTPLPLFHFNALTTAVCGPLVTGGRGAIARDDGLPPRAR